MTVLEIDLIDETKELPAEDKKLVENILQFAADYLKMDQGTELSLTFTTNEGIREINRDYRNKDQATDVISFALEELGEGETEIDWADFDLETPKMLGDIIISTEKAEEQAKEYGHTKARELGFLAVHGLLHLLGYDHMEPDEEKIMFGLQKEVLDAYGLER
ncbi:rRNA maturation RNase YbeY [Listeria ivanovii]|uniref:Endoribonuclease YbeY n=2 Tax=Listeria ivanovii TaxID=1638 RepID=A0ABS1G6W4_LISIV|nr:rRNA maturation RNase YbeY [Listeria ivanovii]AIS59869.1 rRNA maturation factor [Listeria ivanovii subsp. londoniensis]AIS62697.1 rRNA maturation factor [Listeria ivanovii subsp. londoniensis]MBC2254260.1 rRNA maturation RNase YbeY [Listeria ivanovii]MBK1962598.1 rRNA maturation RNase YbeY [Listeria ivanovii subsp. londoniensis]MBK1967280.1 rRNA maturation RNase YbeY [Listeria ivanovii subsp. londoniensis]